MKRIEAFLQPYRISRVVHALHELPHFPGFTVLEGKGQGHGRGTRGHYVGDEVDLVFQDRRVLIVICDDDDATAIAVAIARAAHTGNKHDGIVTVSDVPQMLRVGETPGQGAGRQS